MQQGGMHTIKFQGEEFDLIDEAMLEIFRQIDFCLKDNDGATLVNKHFAFMFTQAASPEEIQDFLRFAEVVRKLASI